MRTHIIATITVAFILLTFSMYLSDRMDAIQGIGNIILALILQQVALIRSDL